MIENHAKEQTGARTEPTKDRRAVLVKVADTMTDAEVDVISPAFRALLLVIRSAAYAIGDAIGDYLEVKKKRNRGRT